MIELIDDFFAEYPATSGGSDKVDTGEADEVIDLRVSAELGRDAKRHRQSAAIGRLLKRLHVRGFVAKVPRTRRWRVTEQGRSVLSDALRTYRRYALAT